MTSAELAVLAALGDLLIAIAILWALFTRLNAIRDASERSAKALEKMAKRQEAPAEEPHEAPRPKRKLPPPPDIDIEDVKRRV